MATRTFIASCVVPAGGLSIDGLRWVRPKVPDYFLPQAALVQSAAATALSVLPSTHEAGRLVGQATPALTLMTSRRVLAGRPFEIPRRRPRRGLVQLDPPAQMNALARHLKPEPRIRSAQLTSKPKAPPAWRRFVGESSHWDGPPEL